MHLGQVHILTPFLRAVFTWAQQPINLNGLLYLQEKGLCSFLKLQLLHFWRPRRFNSILAHLLKNSIFCLQVQESLRFTRIPTYVRRLRGSAVCGVFYNPSGEKSVMAENAAWSFSAAETALSTNCRKLNAYSVFCRIKVMYSFSYVRILSN